MSRWTNLAHLRKQGGPVPPQIFLLSLAGVGLSCCASRSQLRKAEARADAEALVSGMLRGFFLTDSQSAEDRIGALLTSLSDYYQAEALFLCGGGDCEWSAWKNGAYSSCGGSVSPERQARCRQRWEEYCRDYPDSPSDPFPHPLQKGRAKRAWKRPEKTPWLFIPVCGRTGSSSFFCIEGIPGGWSREQLAVVPRLSRIASRALSKWSAERRTRFMAYYDSLTKLPNRQLFHDRLEQAVRLARRNNRILGIVFLDLDFFKSINDSLGHEGGDLLIQAMGKKLSASLRQSDTVARFGGDEFLILINDVAGMEDIFRVADKIMSIFQEPILLKGRKTLITASAGISLFPVHGEDPATLIRRADLAMYAAKEKGKNQYVFWEGDIGEGSPT